jgi:hypothetical protein
MLYMVIERFRDASAVYARFREKGRMLPAGLKYVDSWVEVNHARCFQLMECDDEGLFEHWAAHWNDLVEFDIVPVRTSEDAAAALETVEKVGRGGEQGRATRRGTCRSS